MAIPTWKVKLHEARPQVAFARDRVAADFVEVFGVQAAGPDEAKRAAARWLTARQHEIRSINVAADEERTLVAYVASGSVEKSKKAASGL